MKKENLRLITGIYLIICCLSVCPLLSNSRSLPSPDFNILLPGPYFADSSEDASAAFLNLYYKKQYNNKGLSEEVFNTTMKGYLSLIEQKKIANPGIITIIDFSKPSTEKRLFVLDIEKGEILFETYVSHGKNSGELYAKSFSNTAQSHKSSLGFYVTGETYSGKHGYSLKLEGQERGINDNAYRRAIVIHGAKYVSERYIDTQGFIGRSYGCPALPLNLTKPIIDKIKGGSCLFIYYPSENYIAKSRLL